MPQANSVASLAAGCGFAAPACASSPDSGDTAGSRPYSPAGGRSAISPTRPSRRPAHLQRGLPLQRRRQPHRRSGGAGPVAHPATTSGRGRLAGVADRRWLRRDRRPNRILHPRHSSQRRHVLDAGPQTGDAQLPRTAASRRVIPLGRRGDLRHARTLQPARQNRPRLAANYDGKKGNSRTDDSVNLGKGGVDHRRRAGTRAERTRHDSAPKAPTSSRLILPGHCPPAFATIRQRPTIWPRQHSW